MGVPSYNNPSSSIESKSSDSNNKSQPSLAVATTTTTTQVSPQPQPQEEQISRQEAEQRYLEAMEDQYARQEGGA